MMQVISARQLHPEHCSVITDRGHRPRTRAATTTLTLLLAAALLLAACGQDQGDEATTEDLLAELEGRPLTPAEVAAREEVATLLCGLSDDVLLEVWHQLDPTEFAFQDIVFGRTCPDRKNLYAEATGRLLPNN